MFDFIALMYCLAAVSVGLDLVSGTRVANALETYPELIKTFLGITLAVFGVMLAGVIFKGIF